MTDQSVAIRLGIEGKAQIKADFTEIADSGDANAKRLVNSYEKAGDDIERALQRRDAAAAKIAALMPTNMQSVINANAGTSAYGGYRDAGGGAQGQNANAAQYAALLAQQEQQVDAVRSALDPLYAAQKRYDDEVRIANGLLKQGAISEVERDAAIALSEKALQRAKNGLNEHSSALGLNRTQFMIAESAVHRFVDPVLAGQSPIKAFAMQAGDLATSCRWMTVALPAAWRRCARCSIR